MKHSLLIGVLIIISLIACRKEEHTPISLPSPSKDSTITTPSDDSSVVRHTTLLDHTVASSPAPPILPLKVGNEWVYHRTRQQTGFGDPPEEDTVKITCTGTTRIGSEEYFIMHSTTGAGVFYDEAPAYLRYEAPFYFLYINGQEVTFLIDQGPISTVLPLGTDSQYPYIRNRHKITAINQIVTTPMGTYYDATTFMRWWVQGSYHAQSTVTYYSDYQPNIGLVHLERTWRYTTPTTSIITLDLIAYTLL